MAVTGSFTGNSTLWNHNTGATQIADNFKLEVEYNIDAVDGEQAYNVKLRVRLVSTGRMNYSSLKTVLTLKVDNQSKQTVGSPTMSIKCDSNGGTGPWTGWYTYKYSVGSQKSTINMTVTLDLSEIIGDISGVKGGPDSISRPGWHYNKINANKSVDVSGIVLGRPPVLTSLENRNKYTNPATGVQNLVSVSTTAIGVICNVDDWGDPRATIYWSCGGQSGTSSSDSITIKGLNPGTSYTVSVYMQNSIGKSSTRTITIRTRHNSPVVSISLSDVDLEQLVFDWESDKNLKSTEYKIDDGEWTDLGQAGTSGFFTAQWFDPKTTHTIYFRGTSTNTLDALTSSEKNASGTTHDRAHITNIGECIFGLNISLDIESESDKQLQIKIWVEGNGSSPEFIYDNIGTGDITWTFEPTQDQLDQMYRCYPKSNEIPIHFLLTTHGEWKDWDDDQHDEILLLTGIAKTAHFGDSSNKPRRCQVWFGDENNIPRRAVVWTGVDNKARRTI